MSTKPINNNSITIALLSLFLLGNWTSQPNKQGAQFFGTLVTRPGNTFCVHNITIGSDKKTKAIPVYEKPKDTTMFNRVDNHHYMLSVDPKSSLATIYLDLDKVSQITISNPNHILWTYKNNKGYRQYSYIEIEVTEKAFSSGNLSSTSSTESKKTTSERYLIELDTYIACTRIDGKAPEKMKVQLPAVRYLTIEGYVSEREEHDQSTHPSVTRPTCQPTSQDTHQTKSQSLAPSMPLSTQQMHSLSTVPSWTPARTKHKHCYRKARRHPQTHVS